MIIKGDIWLKDILLFKLNFYLFRKLNYFFDQGSSIIKNNNYG